MKGLEEIKSILAQHREQIRENHHVRSLAVIGSLVRGGRGS